MKQRYYKTVGMILAIALAMPVGVFAQYDPNATYSQGAADNTNAYNAGANSNSSVNNSASNSNNTIFNGASSNNSNAYSQGVSDNSYVNSNANTMNTSQPSTAAYTQWVTTQSQASQTDAKTNATNANGKINNDIFNPNKSYTDVNADLYNAGKTANQNAITTASQNCSTTIKKFGDIFLFAACVINRFLLTSAISLAMIYFVWGVVQYVLSADSAEERKKSKQVMLWGVLALFVIVSMWGIVTFMRTLLGV